MTGSGGGTGDVEFNSVTGSDLSAASDFGVGAFFPAHDSSHRTRAFPRDLIAYIFLVNSRHLLTLMKDYEVDNALIVRDRQEYAHEAHDADEKDSPIDA